MSHSHHCSIWLETHERHPFPALSADGFTEVAVIGAGITGLTTALLLKRAGLNVTVLEARHLGHGTSGWTSAHLATYPDAGFATIERRFDRETSAQVARTLTAALDTIEELAAAHAPDARFERVEGGLGAAAPEHREQLAEESAAAARAGVRSEDAVLPLSLASHGALRLPGQGRFHALAYLDGLARAVDGGGCRVYENSRVVEVEDGEPCRIRTSEGELTARHVVMATHTPIGFNPVQAELTPYRSYVLAVEPETELPNALYWDTAEPYHYLRPGPAANGRPTVLVGGADHRTAHDSERDALGTLREWTARNLDVRREVAHWSAQLYVPADGLPLIGRSPAGDHIWIATGFSGDGLTLGTAAAELIAELILGREPAAARLYRPTRLSLAALPRFVEQSLDTAKRFVADRFTGENPEAARTLQPGEGAVIGDGPRTLAVVRGDDGAVRAFDAVCPHLKCVVHYNALDRTFDCPCHGSRFDSHGEVIEGPALAGLDAVEPPA